MHKLSYFIGLILFALGLVIALGPTGSRRHAEVLLFVVAAIVCGFIGFVLSRVTTKACRSCFERVQRRAVKCKHCQSSLT